MIRSSISAGCITAIAGLRDGSIAAHGGGELDSCPEFGANRELRS